LWGEGDLIGNNCYVTLNWQPPDCSQEDLVTFAYDDGEYPDDATGSSTVSWGNFFPIENYYVLSGKLVSFELFFVYGNLNTDDSLYIDVYDETRNLIGSTGSFLHTGGHWFTLPAPSIPFTGPFYIMLRPIPGSEVNWLGYNYGDTGYDLAWYIENGIWKKVSDVLLKDSILFFIRATAEINGKKKNIYTGDSTILQGYDVYRSDDDGSTFVKLNQALVENLTFQDMIAVGFHPLYTVKAVYDNCESDFCAPFYYEWPCWVGVNEQSFCQQTISPNPALSSIRITSNEKIVKVQILDQLGKIRKEIDGKMEREVLIQLDGLTDGLYLVSIVTDHGQTMSKLIISR
jgi:hypothetical protein